MPIENHYGQMKKYLRKNDKPLEQLIKRLEEEHRSGISRVVKGSLEKGTIRFIKNHCDGPLPENCSG